MTVVTIHLWGTGSARRGLDLTARTTVRLGLGGRASGPAFWRMLGTAKPTSYSSRDADLGHWALLTVWEDRAAADAFDEGEIVAAWDRLAIERARVVMRPIRSTGLWGGVDPFPILDDRPAVGSRVAVITRARIRTRHTARFLGAVPSIAAELAGAPGLGLTFGMGELPFGLLGTFSLWESEHALQGFLRGAASHGRAMRDSRAHAWFSEELFARFAVDALDGWTGGTSR